MALTKGIRALVPASVWEAFNAAVAGDANKGRELAAAIASDIRRGELSSPLRELVAEMLERIAVGEEADIALLVRPGKKRPKTPPNDDFRIWLAVRRRLDKGESPTSAYKEVATEENRARPRVAKLSGVAKPITASGIGQIYRAQKQIHENRTKYTRVHFSAEEIAELRRAQNDDAQHLAAAKAGVARHKSSSEK